MVLAVTVLAVICIGMFPSLAVNFARQAIAAF